MANNLAIIPARGGSKRIPRKNVRPFMGKPIMAYSIEAALKSGLFDEVMVFEYLLFVRKPRRMTTQLWLMLFAR